MSFEGKVALITGSSSGIGAQTAISLSKLGAKVVITGRNSERLDNVSDKCDQISPNGSKSLKVVCDLGSDDDCKRLIDSAIEQFGQIDILVNNAGMALFTTIYDTNIMSSFDTIMNVNLRSVVYLTHLAVKHLQQTKGVVINISSCLGSKPRTNLFAYCMSKSALDMFTKCLAIELGPKGIRVNSVNPAIVRTNFHQAMGITKEQAEANIANRVKQYPIGRVGEPEDIANAVVFLASNDASFITGTILYVDGGHLNV